MDSMESVDLSGDDEEPATITKENVGAFTTCSAPSTPTGERDLPGGFRRPSLSATTANDLSQIEVTYQGVGTNENSPNNDDGTGLIDSFLGCLKPFFSAVNKIGENMKYSRDTSNSS